MKLDAVPARPNILLIAESGRGKTYTLGQFARIAPLAYLTADLRGIETMRSFRDADPELELLTDWRDPWASYDRLAALAKTHRILGIDALGEMQQVIARSIQGHSRGREEERMRYEEHAVMVRRQLLQGGRRLEQSQWGELGVATSNFLEEAMALPYQLVVVTVLEDVREHPRTGADQVYPALLGAIRDDLMARFSLVVNLFLHEEEGATYFCASCRPHPRLPNKTRYGEARTWVDSGNSKTLAERLLAHVKRQPETPETTLERRIGAGQLRAAKKGGGR